MRTRTLLAGATLALLTMAWSAPGAMAAANDGSGSQPPSSSVPAPGSAADSKQTPNADQDKNKPSENTPAPPAPPKPVEPKPVEPKPAEPKPGGPDGRPIAPGEPNPGQPGGVKPGPILSDPKATLSVSPDLVSPGDTITANVNCANSQQVSLTGDGVRFDGTRGTVDRNANGGGHTVTLICANGPKQDRATDTFQVRGIAPGGPGSPGWPGGPGRPGDGDLRATLSVSPRSVRQGDIVTFNGGCSRGQQVDLRADDVNVRGDRGYVDDNAREGDHTATRTCRDGGRQETATDHFRVIRDDDNHGPGGDGPRDLWLSDRSGYRGDSVDVSVRCRDNSARFEADGLNDITLRRDGSRLTGTTHVENRADPGWHRATVSCDGHSDSVGFRVLRDRDDHDRYLSVDPGYGHRGDEVDIHVGCDWSVGRVESDALDDIDVDRDGRDWRYEGSTHVSDDADPGEHTVRVSCGNDTLEESFFVQGDGDHSGDDDSAQPGGGEYVSVYPVGAPETGGGPEYGSDGSDNRGSRGLTALGVLGLTGAALAGTWAAVARRNSRRGAER
jgi:hypothetical protein